MNSDEKEVIELLRKTNGLTLQQIADVVKLDEKSVLNCLRKLEKNNRIKSQVRYIRGQKKLERFYFLVAPTIQRPKIEVEST